MVLFACSGSGSTAIPDAPVVRPLSLTWTAGTRSGSSTAVSVSDGSSLTVVPRGNPPYNGSVYGNCATLQDASTSSSFNAVLSNNVCVLAVQDAAGNVESLEITALTGPPRTSLAISTTGLPSASDVISLTIGQTFDASVNELLVGQSYNAPYQIATQGSCVALTTKSTPSAAAATATITAVRAGQCIVVFSDATGTASSINITVHS